MAAFDGVPLCVDLDGTLISADTLWLSLFAALRTKPWVFSYLPFHVLRGRAAFKDRVSRLVRIDPRQLPYREDVLSFLREAKSARRRLILVTAADTRIAHAVADHLGFFEAIIASDGLSNVKGSGKVEAIRSFLGDVEFDYMGDSMADLPVFTAARQSILVYPSARTLTKARKICRIERAFGAAGPDC